MYDKKITTKHQNRALDYRAKLPGAGEGAPKSTSDGKDLGPHATNSGPKFTNKMLSPGPAARNHGS